MQKFVYEYATKVYFGEGAAKEHLADAVSAYGKNVMLAYGGGSVKKNGIYDELKGILEAAGKRVVDFSGIMSNPTYAKVQEGAKLAKEEGIDFILAVGGGSVIDCCKIVAAQAKTEEDLWDMEMTQHRFPTEVIPMGAVVTASGTGSEILSGYASAPWGSAGPAAPAKASDSRRTHQRPGSGRHPAASGYSQGNCPQGRGCRTCLLPPDVRNGADVRPGGIDRKR